MQEALSVLQRVRQANLVSLVEKFFKGNASEAARVLKESHQYLWQLLKGHRGMGERSARKIEKALDLVPYALDHNKKHRDTEVTLQVGDGESKTFRYVPVRALALPEEKNKKLGSRLCPSEHCPLDAFVVIADGGTEESMNEFREGEVLFVAPFDKKRDKLVNRGHYVVSLVGKKGSGRVLQARANGEGGWLFSTTRGAKRRELAYGDLKVVGRVMLVVRELP